MWSGINQTQTKMWSFIVTSVLAGSVLAIGLFFTEPSSESQLMYLGTMAITDASKHPLYPQTSYLTAVGRSGDSFAAAEATARLGVLRQLVDLATASSADGLADSLVANIEVLVGQVEGSFPDLADNTRTNAPSYNKLIKIDHTVNVRIRGRFYAFAYLPRSAIDPRLLARG